MIEGAVLADEDNDVLDRRRGGDRQRGRGESVAGSLRPRRGSSSERDATLAGQQCRQRNTGTPSSPRLMQSHRGTSCVDSVESALLPALGERNMMGELPD